MKHFSQILIVFVLFFTLILTNSSSAQSRKLQKLYTQGQEHFQSGDYRQAMVAYEEVINTGENHELSVQAHYFYAISAMRSQNFEQAKSYLQKLLSDYPSWQYNSDVYYLLADIAFREQKPQIALSYLQKVSAKDVNEDAKKMKGHFLQKLVVNELRLLMQNNAKDTLVAQVIMDKLAATGETIEDYKLMKELSSQYQLELPKKRKIDRVINKRDPYKVAALMPFNFERVKQRDTTSLFRISSSIYQGMRIAQQELDTVHNMPVALYAYEMPQETSEVEGWFMANEFEQVDLIVGPLRDANFTRVSTLAAKQKIPIINPVSENTDLINSDFSFLYHASKTKQASYVLDFYNGKYRNKNVLILHDNLKRNKSLAECYESATQDKPSLKLLAKKEIKSYQSSEIANIISQYQAEGLGMIIISSTSQVIAEELIKAVRKQNFNGVIFAPEAWLKFQSITYEDYQRANVHIVHPDFIDLETQVNVSFEKKYQDFAHRDANEYARIGYDLMYYFTKLLYEQGSRQSWRESLMKQKVQKGEVFNGFDYRESNDNNYVPILKFTEEAPLLINPIE